MDSISLRVTDYVDKRLEELEKRIHVKLHSIQAAVDKSEVRLDARLLGMNEFREQLNQQNASFMTRSEIEAKFEKIRVEMEAKIEKECVILDGKMKIVMGLMVPVLVGMIILLFQTLMRE